MLVIKKNGTNELFDSNKILQYLNTITNDININIIVEKLVDSIYDGITTNLITLEMAKICSNMMTVNPIYSNLASKILVNELHKNTFNDFIYTMNNINIINPNYLDKEWLDWINQNHIVLNNAIDYTRDFDFDYFGFITLQKSYLLDGERPQHLFMRVASFINKGCIKSTINTYNLLSRKAYIHATPTLFNAGTSRPQLSSCFLLSTEDSIEGITKSWSDVANISKWSGGIGLHISNIRGNNSIIHSTNGKSNGIVPMLQVYNNIARYINQGGKRKGSIAIYLETHHCDILDFLELKKNTGAETERARDLFLALWVSDLFMSKVEKDEDWYLMCPSECPDLNEKYGDEYINLYNSYIMQNKYKHKLPARKLMEKIMDAQLETGTPYMLYKDSINKKSNQKNIGIIKSSNLCAEIVQVSNKEEQSVCNLASISLVESIRPFKQNNKFIIYTKKEDDCIYCKYAIAYLEYNKYDFIEIKGENVISNKRKMECIDGVCLKNNTVYPSIYYNNIYIGGFNELIKFTAHVFDYNNLWQTAYNATKNLNNIIDINFYPTIETKRSNLRNRPIGLGIQGLADTLVQMRIQFDSEEAVKFNKDIMETIYNASMTASKDIARDRYKLLFSHSINHYSNYISNLYEKFNTLDIPEFYTKDFNIFNSSELNVIYHKLKLNKCELNMSKCGSYSTFENSPISKGIFQFDMWDNKNINLLYDWDTLRNEILIYGVRNSLLVALMPTASTSQILGNNECFEWFTSNIYTRRTLAGDFTLVNKYLVNDLISISLWNNDIKQLIIANNGSVDKFNMPIIFKSLYKTIWEIKQIWVLQHALARAPFVDQTQSMNIFMSVPNYKKLYNSHMWSWKNGLKTGMYYLRTNAAEGATKVTIDPKILQDLDNCIACSS